MQEEEKIVIKKSKLKFWMDQMVDVKFFIENENMFLAGHEFGILHESIAEVLLEYEAEEYNV